VRYDRQKIAEFQELQAQIQAKKEVVEEREAEIDAYQTQLDEKHDELSDLTATVKGQLNATNSTLSNERNKLADYDTKIKELDKKMKELEPQVAAAQAKLAQQIAERLALTKEDTSGAYAASATELEWLAATIQAEAGGESYTGKLAVGSVIMNRVKSSAFPNTVISVITQNLQFASYRSGKVELIIAKGPNSTCLRAAQEVLDGARVGDYLFFMTQYYADYYGISEYTMIGNHAFFYRWVTKPKEVVVEEPVPEAAPVENSEPVQEQPQESEPAPEPEPEPEPAPEPAPEPEPEPAPEPAPE
jgi:spore germination cell wall hydrolase CwlJ-like protein